MNSPHVNTLLGSSACCSRSLCDCQRSDAIWLQIACRSLSVRAVFRSFRSFPPWRLTTLWAPCSSNSSCPWSASHWMYCLPSEARRPPRAFTLRLQRSEGSAVPRGLPGSCQVCHGCCWSGLIGETCCQWHTEWSDRFFLVGWLIIEVEQLFNVLKQWITAVPARALSQTNHISHDWFWWVYPYIYSLRRP